MTLTLSVLLTPGTPVATCAGAILGLRVMEQSAYEEVLLQFTNAFACFSFIGIGHGINSFPHNN